MVNVADWMPDLFGRGVFETIESDAQLDGVKQLYNMTMEKVMAQDLKLPAKCVLSKKDFVGSLNKDQPLPQWCRGALKALKFIDKRRLNADQKQQLTWLIDILTGFTSLSKAKQQFDKLGRDYQYNAFEFKRLLTTYLDNTIYEMRFADGVISDPDEPDQLTDGLDSFIDFALQHDGKEVIGDIDSVVEVIEKSMGMGFFEQHSGFFWGLVETRPYMRLRARRAQLNFQHGQADKAIDELQQLLVLNPNDNQANRYPLANYLVVTKRWQALEQLNQQYPEQSLLMLAPLTLASFAQTGDSKQSQKLKIALKQANNNFVLYITGARKVPNQKFNAYSVGDKTEVFCYLELAGKQAWRSVDGALFWLRQN